MIELGHKRPDGLYNVWRWMTIRDRVQTDPETGIRVHWQGFPEWVVVHVVKTWAEGVSWIDAELIRLRHAV